MYLSGLNGRHSVTRMQHCAAGFCALWYLIFEVQVTIVRKFREPSFISSLSTVPECSSLSDCIFAKKMALNASLLSTLLFLGTFLGRAVGLTTVNEGIFCLFSTHVSAHGFWQPCFGTHCRVDTGQPVHELLLLYFCIIRSHTQAITYEK